MVETTLGKAGTQETLLKEAGWGESSPEMWRIKKIFFGLGLEKRFKTEKSPMRILVIDSHMIWA